MIWKTLLAATVVGLPHWMSAATACDHAKKHVHKCGVTTSATVAADKPCGVKLVKIDATAKTNDGRSNDGTAEAAKEFIVVTNRDDDDADGDRNARIHAHAMILAKPDDGSEATIHVFSDAEGDGNAVFMSDDGVAHALKRIEFSDEEDAEERGWLGVSIKNVGEEMADQLDIEGRGVQVLDVIKESPAEMAGILANDVIIAIDGEEVDNEVAHVVTLVSANAPGDEIDVTIIRDGKTQVIPVVLSSRAKMQSFEWKFDAEPFAEIEENFKIRGKMMRRNDDGDWVMEDLGDLGDIDELKKFNFAFPHGQAHATQVWVDGNNKSVAISIKTDDGAIEIKQEDDGEITVVRTDEDGDESTAVYDDDDELKEEDPEAFGHYRKAGKPIMIELNGAGIKGLADVEFDLDLGDMEFEWTADLNEQLEDAFGSYEDAMEHAHAAIENAMNTWHDKHGDGDHPPFAAPHVKNLHGGAFFIGKPKHTFEVDENGVIEVRIRKGDSELVRRFSSEDDLADRNPALYGKYEDLMDLDDK